MLKKKLTNFQIVLDESVMILRNSASPSEAAPRLLEKLGIALGCEWGTFWEVDLHAHLLRPIGTWSASGLNAKQLAKDTQNRNLSLSEGNAGHVWRSHKPIWTIDLVKDMCIPRSLDAENAGLHGGIWFALKTNQAVYGVIELLGRDLAPAEDELLVGIEVFGIQLGKILEQNLDKSS